MCARSFVVLKDVTVLPEVHPARTSFLLGFIHLLDQRGKVLLPLLHDGGQTLLHHQCVDEALGVHIHKCDKRLVALAVLDVHHHGVVHDGVPEELGGLHTKVLRQLRHLDVREHTLLGHGRGRGESDGQRADAGAGDGLRPAVVDVRHFVRRLLAVDLQNFHAVPCIVGCELAQCDGTRRHCAGVNGVRVQVLNALHEALQAGKVVDFGGIETRSIANLNDLDGVKFLGWSPLLFSRFVHSRNSVGIPVFPHAQAARLGALLSLHILVCIEMFARAKIHRAATLLKHADADVLPVAPHVPQEVSALVDVLDLNLYCLLQQELASKLHTLLGKRLVQVSALGGRLQARHAEVDQAALARDEELEPRAAEHVLHQRLQLAAALQEGQVVLELAHIHQLDTLGGCTPGAGNIGEVVHVMFGGGVRIAKHALPLLLCLHLTHHKRFIVGGAGVITTMAHDFGEAFLD
mmetsp:Transcript_45094/g.113576  ORF Transcript_45094/g.113576 Transcript_45094/m.113576 type:complete len:463 (-) Transcript_45094:708-2096(-)